MIDLWNKPSPTWWSGDERVEPFMLRIKQALDRADLSRKSRTDIYNRAYEAVYEAIKQYDGGLNEHSSNEKT